MTMTAKKRSKQQKLTEISFDPMNDPRTIPEGWDVAAFYPPEQHSQNSYGMMRDLDHNQYTASMRNDKSSDPV
jgi:hypothetical protein